MKQEIKIALYLSEFVTHSQLIIFFSSYCFGDLEELFNFIFSHITEDSVLWDGRRDSVEYFLEQLEHIVSELYLEMHDDRLDPDDADIIAELTSIEMLEEYAKVLASMAIKIRNTIMVYLNNGSLSGDINNNCVVELVHPYSLDGEFSGYVDITISQNLLSRDIIDVRSVPYLKQGGRMLYRRNNIPHSPILPILRNY